MATLTKEHEGIIYNEHFQENSLLWSLTPANIDCLRFNQSGLRILHNENYITYTFKEPQDEYCLIAEIEHTPLTSEDVAGLIVLSNTDEYSECQTYLATSPSTIDNNGENLSNGGIETIDLDSKYVRYTIDNGYAIEDTNVDIIIGQILDKLNQNGPYTISDEEIRQMVTEAIANLNDDNYEADDDSLNNDILEVIGVLINGGDGIWIDNGDETQSQSDEPSQTVVNPETGFVDKVYRFLKLVKHNSDYVRIYQFFASSNGKDWIEVGTSTYFNNCSIGFFLYSTKNKSLQDNGNFTIKRMSLYESHYITIRGINILQDFEIISNDLSTTYLRSDTTFGFNVVNHTGNSVIINTRDFNLPINNAILRVYPKTEYNRTIAQYDLQNSTFGGDIFNITYDIKIFIDNQELESGIDYDLGILYTKSFKKDIVVYNNEEFDLGNIRIKIIAYSEYFNGEEEILIAFYDGNKIEQNVNNYKYDKELMIPRLEAHSGVELIMKLENIPKQEFYSAAHDYKFKILIE